MGDPPIGTAATSLLTHSGNATNPGEQHREQRQERPKGQEEGLEPDKRGPEGTGRGGRDRHLDRHRARNHPVLALHLEPLVYMLGWEVRLASSEQAKLHVGVLAAVL